jgi:hypothetical protein
MTQEPRNREPMDHDTRQPNTQEPPIDHQESTGEPPKGVKIQPARGGQVSAGVDKTSGR